MSDMINNLTLGYRGTFQLFGQVLKGTVETFWSYGNWLQAVISAGELVHVYTEQCKMHEVCGRSSGYLTYTYTCLHALLDFETLASIYLPT